jgi:hemerythrin-like domain-containing protein
MPTNILVHEHCLIEQVLGCLERMIERSELERRLEAGPAQDVLTFFCEFTERCHCSKEETYLASVMRAMGASAEQCLGCSMRQRREEGRLHLAAMEKAIGPASAGEGRAMKEFSEHAHAYIELLVEYIAKQEDCLFPMITETLSEADKARLVMRMITNSGDSEDECPYDTYLNVANKLADHYGMPYAKSEGDPAHGD